LHGKHLKDFLTKNLIRFLEANMFAVGTRILGRQKRVTQRMALGFVMKCTKAKIVMAQAVETASSIQADGRAGAVLHAGGGLENSENRMSTFLNDNPAVVAVKLVVCLLEKRPNEEGFRLGFTTIHGPDSGELLETISWVSTGGLRTMVQAIAALAESPRMPTAVNPTFVFKTRFDLDEETYDEALDAVRG
jgi:hypothetical protein